MSRWRFWAAVRTARYRKRTTMLGDIGYWAPGGRITNGRWLREAFRGARRYAQEERLL